MHNMHTGPAMDWTPDFGLHQRFLEWKSKAQVLARGYLGNNNSKADRAQLIHMWLPNPVKRELEKQKIEQDLNISFSNTNPDTLLEMVETYTKPKANPIKAFARLRNMKQGSMKVADFIFQVQQLVDLCGYSTDKPTLVRDVIVTGITSHTAYSKCMEHRDLTLKKAIEICTNDEEHQSHRKPESSSEPVESQREETVHYINGRPSANSSSNWRNSRFSQSSRGPPQHARNQAQRPCNICGKPWSYQHYLNDHLATMRCTKCQGIGHSPKKCPTKLPRQANYQRPQASAPVHHLRREECTSPPESTDQFTGDLDYGAPYFTSNTELPPAHLNQLRSVQVSSIGATEADPSVKPVWLSTKPDGKIAQTTCEIDTGAGCNVIPQKVAQELFQQE